MGQYTANAVELVIFNQPSPLVDVNMSRVLERFFGERRMADIRYDPYLQGLSYKIVDHADTKEMNWAVLDFAALVCKPKPLCLICPISVKCFFYEPSVQTKPAEESEIIELINNYNHNEFALNTKRID